MKPIDMSPYQIKYAGYFIALSPDMRKFLGKGNTPEEALEEAKKKGCNDPVLTKIPHKPKSYLL